MAPAFQQRLAAAYEWEEDSDADAMGDLLGQSGAEAAGAEGDAGLERHKHKHHKKKKKKRKDHPCDYLAGLSNSVVRFGASPGQYTRATAGNNTCYEAVRAHNGFPSTTSYDCCLLFQIPHLNEAH